MCKLLNKYIVEILPFVALLTDTKEPEFSRGCKTIAEVLNSCIHYKEKKDA